mgnify:CR=1 FL=1
MTDPQIRPARTRTVPPGQVSGVCTVGLGQWWAVVMLIPLVAAWALVLTSPAAAVNAFDLSTAVDRHQAVAQSPDAETPTPGGASPTGPSPIEDDGAVPPSRDEPREGGDTGGSATSTVVIGLLTALLTLGFVGWLSRARRNASHTE